MCLPSGRPDERWVTNELSEECRVNRLDSKGSAGYRVMQLDSTKYLKQEVRERIADDVETRLRRPGVTQGEIAAELGISAPRLSALLHGKLDLFSLDYMIEIAHRLGLRVQLSVLRPYRLKGSGQARMAG